MQQKIYFSYSYRLAYKVNIFFVSQLGEREKNRNLKCISLKLLRDMGENIFPHFSKLCHSRILCVKRGFQVGIFCPAEPIGASF